MMRPEELLPEIARRWWIILIAATVAGVTGYIIVSDQPEEYSTSVRLVADAEPADYWLDQYAKNRLAMYVPLIDNHQFVAEALNAANLPIDPGVARSKLQVSLSTTSNTLTIQVTDSEPRRAADTANAIQSAFVGWNEVQNQAMAERVQVDPEIYPARVNLIPVETAGVPSTPNGPAIRSTTIAAALLGIVAGFVIVFVLLYFDRTLKTPEELARYLDRPMLGMVPSGSSPWKGRRST